MGSSLGWKRKSSRRGTGDADRDSRGNVVRRCHRDRRHGRSAGHRTHPYVHNVGHRLPDGYPASLARRAGVAFFTDRLAGLSGDFVYVDEIQSVAEIANLKLSRFAALASR